MSALPDVDDLRLVVEIARSGSVGGAARALRVSQPSASSRLARLERRCDATLFERDTTGARPTAAGVELVRQADHILGHLSGAFAAARGAATQRALIIGCFAGLASLLFPALDALLPGTGVEQRLDHGPVLAQWVSEETMDAAFVAIADQVTLPGGVMTHHVGHDPMVLFRASGVAPAGRGRMPLRDRPVIVSTFDLRLDELMQRLSGLGADARPGVTLATAIAMARRRGQLAALPRSAVAADLHADESIDRLPFRMSVQLSMITGRRPDPRLLGMLPGLRRELGLRRDRRQS
ncbi:LysR family transcriptional regulator [Flexivirga caeni]|uniref:LysR family transcriptional regulator n=1 Tax=Flexivirga caeni TaxID=2294115 RepID=A0A3M9M460_9MICO|nr:LysR family transcriptional regulator [Flexivirga caeni]RNI20344.1 LysR family transcriptional regulator [Flexivirga caeni]